MTDDNNDHDRTLDLPDISLPFFAYGIFKPGQIAYSKIENHVDREKLKFVEINYGMKHRDGVPILIDRLGGHARTRGCVIAFRKGQEEETYGIISKTLSGKLYEWKTIEIDGEPVNVLFGVNPRKGSNHIEDPNERVDFDGKNDPFFKEAIELIERNLDCDAGSSDVDDFFKLQMNYMLLWSAIERYSSLKYNRKSKIENNERFSRQKAFREGIRKFEDEYHRKVFSSDDLEMHEFNVDRPYETLKYYYTLRCNVVHRGKSARSDYSMLESATRELLEIFKDVLRSAFGDSYLR